MAHPSPLEQNQQGAQNPPQNRNVGKEEILPSHELEKYKPLFELEPMSPDAPNKLSAGTLSIEQEPDAKYDDTEGIREEGARLNDIDKHEDTISSIHSPELGIRGPSMRKRFMLTTETDREPSKKQPKLKHSYSSTRRVDGFHPTKQRQVKPKQPDSKSKPKAKLVSSHLHLKSSQKEVSRSRDPLQKQQRHNLFQSSAPKIESSPYNESPNTRIIHKGRNPK